MRRKEYLDFIAGNSLEVVSNEGVEVDVLSHPELKSILKIPKSFDGASSDLLKQGYLNSSTSLGGLVPKMSFVKDVSYIKNGVKMLAPWGIVQEQVLPLTDYLDSKPSCAEGEKCFSDLVDLERSLLARGVFCHDAYWKNCGIANDGEICILDLGGLSKDYHEVCCGLLDVHLPGFGEFGAKQRMNKRGFVVFARMYDLTFDNSNLLSAYEEVYGVDRDDLQWSVLSSEINAYRSEVSEGMQRLHPDIPGYVYEDMNALVGVVMSNPEFSDDLLNVIIRNKYHDFFVDYAQKEIDMWYKADMESACPVEELLE